MDCLLLVLADPPLPPPLFPEGLPWPPPRRRVRRTSFPVPRVAHRLTFPRASSSLPRNMFSLPDLCLADEKRARVVYETFCWDAPRLSGVSRNETLRIRRPTWATDRIFSPLWGGGGVEEGERKIRTYTHSGYFPFLAGRGRRCPGRTPLRPTFTLSSEEDFISPSPDFLPPCPNSGCPIFSSAVVLFSPFVLSFHFFSPLVRILTPIKTYEYLQRFS